MERTYEAPSNEAPHMILGYHQGRLVTYLQFGVFFGIAWGQAQNPTHNVTQFAALLSQSGINVGHLRLVQLHQNLPQYFRRTMSPTVFLVFWEYFAEHVADVFGLFCQHYVADIQIFDDDLGHGNHSGELLLFVGCIVNFVVSYLICMFQDSVPAGSYNDPFLSSVCMYVCR